MRNFAIANYSDLQTISATPTFSQSTYTVPGTGATGTQYIYTFADAGAGKDSTGNYRKYVQIVFQLGAGSQITAALCNARCPVMTYFMGYANGVLGGFTGINAFKDLKVSSSAIATRNPRLIMVVVDRSGSMLFTGGGAFGLPAAVVTFLNFFDTSSDYIGLVSFSSAARLEMPLTTNFLFAGTNDLYDTYQVNTNTDTAIPGVDPEAYTNVNFASGTGSPPPPRRMKFGGQTAADEGLRLALEQLMSNSGYTNPNVVKYIVLFTDGAWNTVRTMVAAPGYTNVVSYPTATPQAGHDSIVLTPAVVATYGAATITNILSTNWYQPVPTLSPWLAYSNSVQYVPTPGSANGFDWQNHTNDVWQSADGINEPVTSPTAKTGASATVNNATCYVNTLPSGENPYADGKPLDVFTSYLNVWLPPGSVDYVYGLLPTPVATYVSSYTNPTNTVNIVLSPGQSNVLVVPGYIMPGTLTDSLDLAYPDNPANGGATYPRYRDDGYNQAFMWPDDTGNTSTATAINNFTSYSYERYLMFRNYANLLVGYYVMRPDDPTGPSTDTNQFTGATNALNANGLYYPSAAVYWPFDQVGYDQYPSFGLRNPISDPDVTGQGNARFIAYTINMLSPAAQPSYAGELFYLGTGGTSSFSGSSAASSQLTSTSQWQTGLPSFATAFSTLMLDDSTNSFINGSTWRPGSFNGTTNASGAVGAMAHSNDLLLTTEVNLSDASNKTGGYVMDGSGNIYRNAMCYSGRPTHYFDFSTSQWKPIPDQHTTSQTGTATMPLSLGDWKAEEYAWHARQGGVTIYTVGYGTAVDATECGVLAKVANAPNIVTPTGGTNPDGSATLSTNSNPSYITGQPVGQQFYATVPSDISNDFYQVGTVISGALTQ
jgi:hypothetical protein